MQDTISDFLTVIRNASRARRDSCAIPYTKLLWNIARILDLEGYISSIAEDKDENGFKTIVINLKYVQEVPAITGIKRWSRPGCRTYYAHSKIPRVLGGLGMGILTTSNGLLKDGDARRKRVGGELICTVW